MKFAKEITMTITNICWLFIFTGKNWLGDQV
jgi:hypothetical protein